MKDYSRKLSYPPEEEAEIKIAYKHLLTALHYEKLSKTERDMLRKGFELAADSHVEQRRKSGIAYIHHPIAVAEICVKEIGLGVTCVVAALLHDVVEDTATTLPEITQLFGAEISTLVAGLTKLDHENLRNYQTDDRFPFKIDESLSDKERLQQLNAHKILISMYEDIRIIYIKLADRLHNLRTIDSMSLEKKLRIADETEMLYIPLAHRLGFNKIKTEFEDTCLCIKNPSAFESIQKYLDSTDETRNAYIEKFIEPLYKPLLDNLKLPFVLNGRPKSIFSIHEKMMLTNKPIGDIFDLFAIRVIIQNETASEDKAVCYQAYSTITDIYRQVPNKFKDYISNPKPNGYESLHDVLFGPESNIVEVQIRTKRMDEIADRGAAAHYFYKEHQRTGLRGFDKTHENYIDRFLKRIRDEANASGSFNNLVLELYKKDIIAYTPDGAPKMLPVGATVLDFAYSIHTDVGNKCGMGMVNEKQVPLGHKLSTGDVVKIITNKNNSPTPDWLDLVVTGRAINKIRVALRDLRKKGSELGKERLMRKLKSLRANSESKNLDLIQKFFHYKSSVELFEDVQNSVFDLNTLTVHFSVQNGQLIERIEAIKTHKTSAEPKPAPSKGGIEIYPLADYYIEINDSVSFYDVDFNASCCKPSPRQPIFAYQALGRGYRIHTQTCPNKNDLSNHSSRVVKAEWVDKKNRPFKATFEIIGVDYGKGVIANMTNYISVDLQTNMLSYQISTNENGYFNCHVTLLLESHFHFQQVFRGLGMFEGVNNLQRIG